MQEHHFSHSSNSLDAIVVLRNGERNIPIKEREEVRRFQRVLGPLDSGVGRAGIESRRKTDEEGT